MMQTLDSLTFAHRMREEIIKMIHAAGSGHPGGSLSATDIIAVLYNDTMRIDPQQPRWEDRDRFILTKGHAAPALYAALSLCGYFPLEDLANLRKLGSHLQGHPEMNKLPGVDISTGSLGQGLSAACGIALGGKMNHKDYHVYALMGDGEQQEGQIWEAAMFAAHYKLDNLIAFLDHNHLQIDGHPSDVMNPEPLDEKWKAFGWKVLYCDGHNHDSIKQALKEAHQVSGQPVLILAETVKGKGISFMENVAGWHGTAPNEEQAALALAELED